MPSTLLSLIVILFLGYLLLTRRARVKSPTLKSPQHLKIPVPEPLYITPEQVSQYDDRPWRPFRWPYHQTMSIFKLDINHWLDMDKYYVHYYREKQRILHEYGDDHFVALPESEEACLELMFTVRDHMLRRYPLLFTTSDGGETVRNELIGETLCFAEPLKEHPLVMVSKMAKEDFYVVQKRSDGLHYLTALAVPFPGGGFGIRPIVGKHIDEIHTGVPYYKEKLQRSLEKWLGRISAAELTERASWHITWDHKLQSNDVYTLKLGDKIQSSILPDQFNVRIERQAFRRLPKSQAVIFTNHPLFYSIDEMKDEPLVPSLIKKIIWEGPPDIVKSKHYDIVRERISEYLDSLITRQYELGIITPETKVKTLPSYPFAQFIDEKHMDFGWINPSASNDPDLNNYLPKAELELSKEGVVY